MPNMRQAQDQPPDLEFAVLGARPVKYAAAPMLTVDLQVSEGSGRAVYMIALTIQLMIEREHGRGGVLDRARSEDVEDEVGRRLGAVERGRLRVQLDRQAGTAFARRSSKNRSTAACTPEPPEIPSQCALIVPVSA